MENIKIMTLPEVTAKTRICRSKLYTMVAAGEFPKPLKLGMRSVGWIEEEINAWFRARIAERDGVDLPEPEVIMPVQLKLWPDDTDADLVDAPSADLDLEV